MLGSALELAADISQRRSRNEFALLVWQLGEVCVDVPLGLLAHIHSYLI
jgi:hypothetical protein